MSFSPPDFLELAKELVEGDADPEQAAFRSAISRGYYSVLLTIKHRVQKLGFEFPRYESHKEVSDKLEGIGGHANRIRNDLDTLRYRRNEADYNLPGEIYSQERAEELVAKCEKLKRSCDSASDNLYRRLGRKLNPEPPDPRQYR